MKNYQFSIDGHTWHVTTVGSGKPVLLLHGFTGSSESWAEVASALADRNQLIMPDFLGHGRSDAPNVVDAYSMERTKGALLQIMKQLGHESFICIGYSMGGRVALSLAAHDPRAIAGLVLESTSPGLRTELERAQRRENDERLAERILDIGVEAFVTEWEQIPLFSTQNRLPNVVRSRQREIRTSHRAAGLAGSLRGLGTGAQPSVWESLSQVSMPTLVITGEQDIKFCRIADEMMEVLPNATHIVVEASGHTVHMEQPQRYVHEVKRFLQDTTG